LNEWSLKKEPLNKNENSLGINLKNPYIVDEIKILNILLAKCDVPHLSLFRHDDRSECSHDTTGKIATEIWLLLDI